VGPRKLLAAAACALLFCLAAGSQGRATVIVDRGKGVANPGVETGGHSVPPGTPRPVISTILLDTTWLTPVNLCPWPPFSLASLPWHTPARVRLPPPRRDNPNRTVWPAR
jgi:hypothetical protein